MGRRRSRSIAQDLTVWISTSLVAVALLVSGAAFLASRTLRARELQDHIDTSVRHLADSLAIPVWNLDRASIGRYFDAYPPDVSLVEVCISTQFGDALYRRRFMPDVNVMTAGADVICRGESVGRVDASFSRRRLQMGLGGLARISLLGVILGICATILPVSYLLNIRLGGALRDVVRQLREIAGGSFQGRLRGHSYEEIDLINREVNLMVDQISIRTEQLQREIRDRRTAQEDLQTVHAHLEQLVDERTAALRATGEQLRRESAERRRIQSEMLQAVTGEQQRIGQDLHDTICQELAGIAFMCSSIERALRAQDSSSSRQIGEIAELIRRAVASTHRIAKGLSPVDMSENGLANAFEELAAETARVYRIACEFSCGGEAHVWNSAVALHLYYIAREAIHNAIRHGHATDISLRLALGDHCGALVVTDNGIGFDTAMATGAGMGLRSMRYRTEEIGGAFDIVSQPGQGTAVSVTFANTPALPDAASAPQNG